MNGGFVSIIKIAAALRETRQAADKRARLENWSNKLAPGRGRGGKKRLYPVESLPLDVQLALLEGDKSEDQNTPTLDLEQAETSLNTWEQAPDKLKKKARAWEKIIINFEGSRRGQKLEDFKPEYVAQYNAGNVFLGISSKTYQIIPKISVGTLEDKRTKHKAFGLVELLDSDQRGRPKPKLTPAEIKYILGLQIQNPHRRPAWIYKYYQNKFGRVSNKTVKRFLTKWKKENPQLWELLKNPDGFRNKYQAAPGNASLKAQYFLHIIEFDCTPADIMCADGKRYTLMAAIDIFSRKVICLVVPTGSAIGVLNLIRNIITQLGLFDVMIHDNGNEFCANDIQIACKLLKIKDLCLPPFAPWKKSFIERFFGTVSIFLEELLGFIGHDVGERKEIEARKSFAERMFDKNEVIECALTRDQLQKEINTWIEVVYHQDKHSSLGMCPEAKAGQTSKPVRKVEDTEALKVLLAPCGKRTIQKKGIFFDNGIYWAKELALHIGEQVQIRRDFGDVGLLYVFNLKMRFICVARDSEIEGITLEEAKAARKFQRRQLREQRSAVKALAKKVGDPMGELIEMKRKEPGQIRALHKEETFENDAIREAGKAVRERTEGEANERKEVATAGGPSFSARLLATFAPPEKPKDRTQPRLVKKLSYRGLNDDL